VDKVGNEAGRAGLKGRKLTFHMNCWKVYCMEEAYPGLWYTWFRDQVAAVGWPPDDFHLEDGSGQHGWGAARNYLQQVSVGDSLVVQLSGNLVGRVGTVTGKRIADSEWHPTVPISSDLPQGEQGRRIEVRWDLSFGEVSPQHVVELPLAARFARGPELRWSIYPLDEQKFAEISRAMLDEKNWVTLVGGFRHEASLSDYIASAPHLLEDGMRPYPWKKAREQVFPDKTRSDVLLLDKHEKLVVVECKQGSPTVENIEQLRGYMAHAARWANVQSVRGVLVHGGSLNLSADVRSAAHERPSVELVRYVISVGFVRSL
jgi:hypothetical protein